MSSHSSGTQPPRRPPLTQDIDLILLIPLTCLAVAGVVYLIVSFSAAGGFAQAVNQVTANWDARMAEAAGRQDQLAQKMMLAFFGVTFGIIVLFIDLILLLCLWVTRLLRKRHEKGCVAPVSARIVSVRRQEVPLGRSHQVAYFPTYRYYLDGQTVSVEARFSSGQAEDFPIGDAVDALVAPGHPERIRVPGEWNRQIRGLSLATGITFAVGAALLLPGLFFLLL